MKQFDDSGDPSRVPDQPGIDIHSELLSSARTDLFMAQLRLVEAPPSVTVVLNFLDAEQAYVGEYDHVVLNALKNGVTFKLVFDFARSERAFRQGTWVEALRWRRPFWPDRLRRKRHRVRKYQEFLGYQDPGLDAKLREGFLELNDEEESWTDYLPQAGQQQKVADCLGICVRQEVQVEHNQFLGVLGPVGYLATMETRVKSGGLLKDAVDG